MKRKSLTRHFLAHIPSLATLIFLTGCLASCGNKNAYEAQAPDSLYEQAQLDMESSTPDGYRAAQSKLETYLAENPADSPARSLLAASLAAQAGIILIDVASRATDDEGSEDGGGGVMASLTNIVPTGSDANIALIARAVTELQAIPATDVTSEITYAAGIYSMCHSLMIMKKATASVESLATLTPEEAIAFIGALQTSSEFLATAQNPAIAELASKLDETTAEIIKNPDEEQVEKVRSYLSKFVQQPTDQ